MKTANDFAKLAINLRNISAIMQPEGKYSDTQKLIQYHLNTAARQCEAIAEDIAKNETEGKA